MRSGLGTLATLQRIVKQQWRHQASRYREHLSGRPLAWLSTLADRGYVVVPGFLSRDECQALIGEVHRLEADYPQYVQVRSDRRVFGANRVSRPIRAFAEHPELVAMARANYHKANVCCVTLSQRLAFSEGNLGSGEGWHRDSYAPQFKTIVYLTDVGNDQGPFEIVPGSHRLSNMVVDTIAMRVEAGRTRFSSEEVARIVAQRYPEGIATLTGEAGTLVLAATSAFHRGRPIEAGERYALANYFLPQAQVPQESEAHFGAIPPALAIP